MNDSWKNFEQAAARARAEAPPALDVRAAVAARIADGLQYAPAEEFAGRDPLSRDLLWVLAAGLGAVAAGLLMIASATTPDAWQSLAWGGLVDPLSWNPYGL